MILPPVRRPDARITLLLALVLAANPAAHADEKELKDRIDRLEQELKIRDGLIRNLLDRLNALEDAQSTRTKPPQASPATQSAPQPGQPASGAQPPAAAPEAAPKRSEAPPPRQDNLAQLRASAAFERTLIERGALLLGPSVWELEPSFSYSHSSADRVVIDGFTVGQVLVIGDIFSERVDRDVAQVALTGRLGLPWNSQVEIRIPYAQVTQKVYDAQNRERRSSTTGLGDVELAYSQQFHHGGGTEPSILGSLRWKTTTGDDPLKDTQRTATFGTGFHSLQATATAVQISDPAVFFGSLTYTANLAANKPVGRVDPGDSYGYQVGIALSVNMDTSLSFGWEQRYTQRTEVEGQSIAGSYFTSGSLSIGVTHTAFSGRTYDLKASIGLTRDAPEAQITLSIPFRF